MQPKAVRARPAIFALAVLAVAAGACGGRFDRSVAPADLLKVNVPAGASPKVLSGVRSAPGVAHVAGFTLVDVRTSGARAPTVNIAVGDPDEIQPLAAALAEDAPVSASNLRDGWLLLSAGEREQLGIAPGGALTVRDAKGASHALRVADLGPALEVAAVDGIVARDRVPWIDARRPTLLIVAVAPGADPNVTASAVGARLGSPVAVAAKGPSFLTGRAASRLFGSFSYVINGDGTITQNPSWVRRYIVRARVPIFRWVTCHRMMITQLRGALSEVQRAGLSSKIALGEAGGCYVARQMLWDPKLPISMHAWGLAIDFNVEENQYGARPTMDPRIVEIFERWGFAWGGRWRTPDGMHFELAAIIRR